MQHQQGWLKLRVGEEIFFSPLHPSRTKFCFLLLSTLSSHCFGGCLVRKNSLQEISVLWKAVGSVTVPASWDLVFRIRLKAVWWGVNTKAAPAFPGLCPGERWPCRLIVSFFSHHAHLEETRMWTENSGGWGWASVADSCQLEQGPGFYP